MELVNLNSSTSGTKFVKLIVVSTVHLFVCQTISEQFILFFWLHEATNMTNKTFRSRKKTRNLKTRKESVRKALVRRGDQHVTKSGKIIQKKQFLAQTECKCKRNCSQSINTSRQMQIFQEFYRFNNWNQKTLSLRSLIKSSIPEKKLKSGQTN